MTAPDTTARRGDISVFDRFSTLYDRFKPATSSRTLTAGLDRAERDIQRVLDVGGGSGQGVRGLDVPEGLVADAAPGMVRRARKRGVDAVQADARRLPVATGSVDAVLILDALHHIGDPQDVLNDAARVLRSGGVLVVLEFDPTTLAGRVLEAGEHLVGMDSTFYSPAALVAMVDRAGLDGAVVEGGFEYLVAGVKTGELRTGSANDEP